MVKTASSGKRTGATKIAPEPSSGFVITPYVREIAERALSYLHAGYPVHFAGPSGTGKTTLAFHLASLWGRPVTLIHGNDDLNTADLVGSSDAGFRRNRVVDNFIHSVLKTEEEVRRTWADDKLTIACRNGDTLIYDEFNRSRPEANNVLLSVLAEGILNLPALRTNGEAYLDVHPLFRAIFTSNPEEYAGTHKTQDALMDRMITIELGFPDRDTEVAITMARAGLPREEAGYIVDVIRELRGSGESRSRPSLRAGIAIGRIIRHAGAQPRYGDMLFHKICYDALSMETAKVRREGRSLLHKMIDDVIKKVCPPLERGAKLASPEQTLTAE